MSRVNTVAREMTQNLDKYELGTAVNKVYDFAWNEFCDWYIEIVKPRLYNSENKISKQAALFTLKSVLEDILKLLHPFMPFITEEIWGHLNPDTMIIVSDWCVYDESRNYPQEEQVMDNIINSITKMRNARANMNIPPSKKQNYIFLCRMTVKRIV